MNATGKSYPYTQLEDRVSAAPVQRTMSAELCACKPQAAVDVKIRLYILGWGVFTVRPALNIPCYIAKEPKKHRLFCDISKFGASTGTRTPGLLLRRQLLYPTELRVHKMERVMGIEPTRPAWKAGILPLNYTRN